jgi:hypothetical protein
MIYRRVEFQKSLKCILSYNFFIMKDLSRHDDTFFSVNKTIRIANINEKTNNTRNKGPNC